MLNSNRVILNSISLYLNMIVNILVQLLCVRLLVKSLGISDYAIYSLIGGVVALFAFINVAMSASTQRFLSYAIGEGKPEKLKEIFYQSVVLHLIIGAIVLVALEIGGIYYVHYLLKAPEERIAAATVLLHCITASTFVNIITVPYEADINANEDIGTIAAINILDSLGKLGIAIAVYYATCDKLVLYGILTMLCLITTLTTKRVYCLRHYAESHFRWHKVHDLSQVKNIIAFTAWNLIGSGCGLARYQGTGMILNQFFQLAVNTAYGIAQQVNALLLFFANSIVRAIRPQIVKSEGLGQRDRMLRLSTSTCKITSLMVALMAIPLGVNIPYILDLWLNEPASYETIMFCRYFLAIVFINQLTIGILVAFESTGRIKELQCFVGTLHLIPLFLGYICFYMKLPADSIMLCILGEEVIALGIRVALANRLLYLNWRKFTTHTLLPCITGVGLILLGTYYLNNFFVQYPLLQLFITTTFSTTFLCTISYIWIMDTSEQQVVKGFVIHVMQRLGKRH